MRTISLTLLFFAMLLLAACSGASSQVTPATTAPATIALVTTPNPAKVGDVELRFTVTDSQGQPVAGAEFEVFADHTDMSGMTMSGKATEQGNGVYAITANFSMAGNWKVSVGVRTPSLEHKQDLELKVQ